MNFFTVLAYLMFFIGASQANLKSDLQEFCDLIPEDKIIEIGTKYFLYDDEFKELINHSKNPELAREWHQLANHPEVKKLIDYLEKNDVDIKKATCELYTLIENNQVPKTSHHMPADKKISGGVTGFIEDVKAVVPTDDLLSLAEVKIRHSRSVRELYQKVSDMDVKAIGKSIQNSRALNSYIAQIKSFGVNIPKYNRQLFRFFGWH